MKLSKRDSKLLLMLAGLLTFLFSYLLVYNPFTARQEDVASQIAELQPQLDTLEEYQANLPTY